MSSSDPVIKAKEYAANKFASALDDILRQSDESVAEVLAQFAARGLVASGAMAKAVGDNYAKLLKDLIRVRVDALIDGFELYGVSIADDLMNFIVKDATDFRAQYGPILVKTMSSRAPHVAAMATHIVQQVVVPIAAIRCQIEERRARPKMAPQQPPNVTNVYHLSGPNARVNVQSTDQSVNQVFATSEQVFQKLRETIQSGIPGEQQAEVLARLEAMKNAENTPSFAARYSEFIAEAANHMTLISPFIPALTELLRKIL